MVHGDPDQCDALAEHVAGGGGKLAAAPPVLRGRYGLSSKEFTPGMVKAVFDNVISFDPVILPQPIKAGAPVIGTAFSTTTIAELEAGLTEHDAESPTPS